MIDMISIILKCTCGLVIMFFSLRFLYLSAKINFTYDRKIEVKKEIFVKHAMLLLCSAIPVYAFSKFSPLDNSKNPFLSIMFILCAMLVLYLNSINNSLMKELKKE
jgi:hypothetical protein